MEPSKKYKVTQNCNSQNSLFIYFYYYLFLNLNYLLCVRHFIQFHGLNYEYNKSIVLAGCIQNMDTTAQW